MRVQKESKVQTWHAEGKIKLLFIKSHIYLAGSV